MLLGQSPKGLLKVLEDLEIRVQVETIQTAALLKSANLLWRVSETRRDLLSLKLLWACPRGVMVKTMDCGIVVSEFVLQWCYYVHFRTSTLGKVMNPLILPAMGWIVPLLFFKENSFGIECPTKVDVPLNREIEPTKFHWKTLKGVK